MLAVTLKSSNFGARLSRLGGGVAERARGGNGGLEKFLRNCLTKALREAESTLRIQSGLTFAFQERVA